MKKIVDFDSSNHYSLSLKGQLQVGSLSEPEVVGLFLVGKTLGNILPQLLVGYFCNLQLSGKQGEKVRDVDNDKNYVVRAQSSNNKYALPRSGVRGSDRDFDLEDFERSLQKTDGFILVKRDFFPKLEIVTLTSEDYSKINITASGASVDDIAFSTLKYTAANEVVI